MAAPSVTETNNNLYTTTWNRRRDAGLIDQYFNHRMVLAYWNASGRRKPDTGGRYIEVPASIAPNETVAWIGRGGGVSLEETDHMRVLRFPRKRIAANISIFSDDEAANMGAAKKIDLVNAELDNAKDSILDQLNLAILGAADEDSFTLTGIQHIINSAPATGGTVGGFSMTTYPWWRNKQKTSTGSYHLYLIEDMTNLWNTVSTSQGSQEAKAILTGQTPYEYYGEVAKEERRVYNKMMLDAGYKSLEFNGAPLIWDVAGPSDKMYFVSQYIELQFHSKYNMSQTDWKEIPNQPDDRVKQIVWRGNLITRRQRCNGVLTSISS